MAPDTPENRLTRIEEKVQRNERQIDTLGPLVLKVERVQWGLDELAEDLKQLRADMREQRVSDKKARADEIHDLRRSFSDQVLVVTDGLKRCSDKITEVAETQRKHHEAEARRHEEEQKTIRIERTQDVVSKRTLYGVLGAAGVAALAAVLAPIISAIFG